MAVVGSGPAGLTAALRLRQMGYGVTVFEALPVAGGMMAVGIPDYRLPRETLNEEIQNVIRAGVEMKLNTALGRDFTIDEPDEPRRLQGRGPGPRRAQQPQAGHRRRGRAGRATTACTSCGTWPWARRRT